MKKPNTSICAVPANDSSSPSRSIVCVPTVGAVPSAVAQVNALASVMVPPAVGAVVVVGPEALL